VRRRGGQASIPQDPVRRTRSGVDFAARHSGPARHLLPRLPTARQGRRAKSAAPKTAAEQERRPQAPAGSGKRAKESEQKSAEAQRKAENARNARERSRNTRSEVASPASTKGEPFYLEDAQIEQEKGAGAQRRRAVLQLSLFFRHAFFWRGLTLRAPGVIGVPMAD